MTPIAESGRPVYDGIPAGPFCVALPGGRLHLQHGPIDLVLCAEGASGEVTKAYAQAREAFEPVLGELVRELPLLKIPLGSRQPEVSGPVAREMVRAVWPYRDSYVTPMAAVAGSVAAHVLAALVDGRSLERAYVGNGGDIALWLAGDAEVSLGVVSKLDAPRMDRRVTIKSGCPVRGVATSGWGGRSFSLGIADAVTVFAGDAPAADAAATAIANGVNVDHPGIQRVPASQLAEESDLGETPVTVGVSIAEPAVMGRALEQGAEEATRRVRSGTILGALLFAGGQQREVGWCG